MIGFSRNHDLEPDFTIVSIGSCMTDAVSIFTTLRVALTTNHVNGTMSIHITSFGSIFFISYSAPPAPNMFAKATLTSMNPNIT